MTRPKLAVAFLSAAFVVAGCNNVRPPIEGRQDPYGRPQITFASDDLRNKTAVGQPILTRDESNLLFVAVPIRSAVNDPLYVEYRVTFFDRNRNVITQTSWLRKDLSPNVPDQITANSTSPRAEDVQVDFRKGELFRP
jgi:hypothetical protein